MGAIEATLDAIAAACGGACQVVAICGRNKKLARRLQNRWAARPRARSHKGGQRGLSPCVLLEMLQACAARLPKPARCTPEWQQPRALAKDSERGRAPGRRPPASRTARVGTACGAAAQGMSARAQGVPGRHARAGQGLCGQHVRVDVRLQCHRDEGRAWHDCRGAHLRPAGRPQRLHPLPGALARTQRIARRGRRAGAPSSWLAASLSRWLRGTPGPTVRCVFDAAVTGSWRRRRQQHGPVLCPNPTLVPAQEFGNVEYVVDNGFGIFQREPERIAAQLSAWFSTERAALDAIARRCAEVRRPVACSRAARAACAAWLSPVFCWRRCARAAGCGRRRARGVGSLRAALGPARGC